jgi:hypothetical protein
MGQDFVFDKSKFHRSRPKGTAPEIPLLISIRDREIGKKNGVKPSKNNYVLGKMVGSEGLEPPTSCL